MPDPYPRWSYLPRSSRPPAWVDQFVGLVAARQDEIDSRVHRMDSDKVLASLAPGLKAMGFELEQSKARADRIRRPVLFGDEGSERVAYEIDAFHDPLGIVLEVEAGRGRHGGALFRDLIRASLIVGAQYLAIGMLREYRYKVRGKETRGDDYKWALAELDAIYASGRLRLPFEGVLLFDY